MNWDFLLTLIPVFYLPAIASWVKYKAANHQNDPLRYFVNTVNPWRGAMWSAIMLLILPSVIMVFYVGVDPFSPEGQSFSKPVLFALWFFSYPLNLIIFRTCLAKLESNKNWRIKAALYIAWDIIKHAALIAVMVTASLIMHGYILDVR